MSTITPPATETINITYSEASNIDLEIESLSTKLFQLGNIVSLVGFAAEARRTLRAVECALHFRPEMEKILSESVRYRSEWSSLPDVSGLVLADTAQQLEILNTALSDATLPLRQALNQADKAGGR